MNYSIQTHPKIWGDFENGEFTVKAFTVTNNLYCALEYTNAAFYDNAYLCNMQNYVFIHRIQ